MAHENATDQTVTDLPTVPVYNDSNEKKHRERYNKSGYYGIMFAPEYSWGTRRCIEEAYGDAPNTPRSQGVRGQSRRSLRFHTDWLDLETAIECVTAVPPYNRFDPDAVADALEHIPAETKVVIGRESSPVMYLWTAQARSVMDTLAGIPFESEHATEGVFAPSGPDELGAVPADEVTSYPLRVVGERRKDVSDGRPMLIRAWWD